MRKAQEDSLAVAKGVDNQDILVVCDGMGGHAAGDTASKIAATKAVATLIDLDARADPEPALQGTLAAVNNALAAHVQANPQVRGMGTTLVAALVRGQRLHWASVGDSHLYLVRNGQAQKLNADHSMKPQLDRLVQEGEISAEQAANDPKRHTLRSALVGQDLRLYEVAEAPFDLATGDLIVLATDGVDTFGIERFFDQGVHSPDDSPQQIADGLMDAVEGQGIDYQDNTSLVVARFGALDVAHPSVVADNLPPVGASPPHPKRGFWTLLMVLCAALGAFGAFAYNFWLTPKDDLPGTFHLAPSTPADFDPPPEPSPPDAQSADDKGASPADTTPTDTTPADTTSTNQATSGAVSPRGGSGSDVTPIPEQRDNQATTDGTASTATVDPVATTPLPTPDLDQKTTENAVIDQDAPTPRVQAAGSGGVDPLEYEIP